MSTNISFFRAASYSNAIKQLDSIIHLAKNGNSSRCPYRASLLHVQHRIVSRVRNQDEFN
jgi:hypothetical protein